MALYIPSVKLVGFKHLGQCLYITTMNIQAQEKFWGKVVVLGGD